MRHFSKAEMEMANKYIKCTISLPIREMQVKTTRCHFTQNRMTIIKNKHKITNAGKVVEEKEICMLLVGMPISPVTIKNSLETPQKTKNATSS
jgi:hypothetical protein